MFKFGQEGFDLGNEKNGVGSLVVPYGSTRQGSQGDGPKSRVRWGYVRPSGGSGPRNNQGDTKPENGPLSSTVPLYTHWD